MEKPAGNCFLLNVSDVLTVCEGSSLMGSILCLGKRLRKAIVHSVFLIITGYLLSGLLEDDE